jgi:hypothetical protein
LTFSGVGNILSALRTFGRTDLAAIETIRQKLPFLVGLSPEQRRSLPKMGDRSRAFVSKALAVAQHNSDFLPRSFSVGEVERDVVPADAPLPIIVSPTRLQEQLTDTTRRSGARLSPPRSSSTGTGASPGFPGPMVEEAKEMDSTIIAALISAVASIFVALLGMGSSPASVSGRDGSTRTYAIPKRNRWIWSVVVFILAAWMVCAALFLHWDIAGASGLAIPFVIWFLSLTFPIRPSSAAAATLFLFPFAFAAEPVGKWRHGISFQNHLDTNVLGVYLGAAFGTALFAWLITRWRRRSYLTTDYDAQTPTISGAFAKEFSELAELNRAGVLSDEEFIRAKNKLLSL